MTTCTDTFQITIQAAEKITGVDAEIFTSPIRTNAAHRARSAVFLVLQHRGWSALRISRFFKSYKHDHVDISTVTRCIQRAKKLLQADESFGSLCEQIKAEVIASKSTERTVAIGLRYSR